MFGLHQRADVDLDKRAQDRGAQHHQRADAACGAEDGRIEAEAWPKHDHHPDEAKRHGTDADQPDALAQHQGGEDDGENRGGVADGRHLGQGQQAKACKGQRHGGGAKETAPDVAHEILWDQRLAHFTPVPDPCEDHGHGKEGSEEDGLPGRHVFGCHLDHGGHDHEQENRHQLEHDGGGWFVRGRGAIHCLDPWRLTRPKASVSPGLRRPAAR